jgi:heavy metal efflux system protein
MLLAALLTLLVVFVLVGAAINSFRDALLVFAVLPAGITGGIVALFVRGMRFSPPAAIGLIAILMLTLFNGVVMVSSMSRTRKQGTTMATAVFSAATSRLRLILFTALVLTFGFIPMALTTGIGAEIQRPLATVVIGGVISSTLTTLLLLPTLFKWIESRYPQPHQ